MKQEDQYISLKEAARISGYSPDYIGQLIRKGKLPGKQVFSNVAWVTTEDAIHEYLDGLKGGKQTSEREKRAFVLDSLLSIEGLTRMYTALARATIVVLVLFALFLGYVFAVSIDRSIERNIESRISTAL